MKRILFLAFLIPGIAWAQPVFIAKSTPGSTSCVAGHACSATVDTKGNQYVVLGSGAASALAEATPIAMITVIAVPTGIGTPQFSNTSALCKTFVTNNSNVDVDVALNGAVVNHKRVPAGAEWFENWCSNGQKMSGAIQINVPNGAATPATGSVVIGGSSR